MNGIWGAEWRQSRRRARREGGAADALLARISMPYSSRGRRSTSSQQSLTSVFAFSHGSGFIYNSNISLKNVFFSILKKIKHRTMGRKDFFVL